jgi:uncharacterized protein (TIGR00251 family)
VEAFELRATSPSHCTLSVRAQPNAKRNALVGVWNGHLKIAVRAPAQDGRANAELILVLAKALGLKPHALSLLGGDKSRLKDVSLALPIEEARRRLQQHLFES